MHILPFFTPYDGCDAGFEPIRGTTSTGVNPRVFKDPAGEGWHPYEIADATRLTDESFYVGQLVQDPHGRWIFIAFHNDHWSGGSGGSLTDPRPVRWDGDVLRIQHTHRPCATPL